MLSFFCVTVVRADDLVPYQADAPLEQFSSPIEVRKSRQNLRLPAEEMMEMEQAFVRILNEEFYVLYDSNRKLFLADIRRGLVGVFRDNDGVIQSYRRLYAANLYSSYNRDAAEVVTESNKENPAIRTHERITARTLLSDDGTKEKIVIGKYSSGKQWPSETITNLECPVVFINLPLNTNGNVQTLQFEKSLHRYIASIQINDGQRALVLSVDSKNEIQSGFYAPQIKGIHNFLPNPEYIKAWFKAKYVKPDWPHVKLALISSLIQFGSAVAITFCFKPENFHLVPAIANGLFALLICSHSKTYERVVKSDSFLWEAFKRLLIAVPMGMVVAGINHQPNPLDALTDANAWYQVTVISYMDRIVSTVMNKIPRWRDTVGMSAGTYKIAGFDTGLPGDSTEREIPAILRNIPKFSAFLLVSGTVLIPAGTQLMLSMIPVAILVNLYWAKKNEKAHPKLAHELKNYKRSLNVWGKANGVIPKLVNAADNAILHTQISLRDPAGFLKRTKTAIESKWRRCKYAIASLK